MAGLGDISAYERMLYGNVEDDADLEAELLALQDEIELGDDDDDVPVARKTAKKQAPVAASRPKNTMGDIDRLARQISQEINVEDDENDATVEDDPDLLAELGIVISDDEDDDEPVKSQQKFASKDRNSDDEQKPKNDPRGLVILLEDRLTNYKAAHKSAGDANDGPKMRRLERGIKTLQDQLSTAKTGRGVDPNDIPPAIAFRPADVEAKTEKPPPHQLPPIQRPSPEPKPMPAPEMKPPPLPVREHVQPPAPPPRFPKAEPKETQEKSATRELLYKRREEFKQATFEAKQRNDKGAALEYFKVCKQFDRVIEAHENGQPVDLSCMPVLPSSPSREQAPKTTTVAVAQRNVEENEEETGSPSGAASLFKAPPPPSSVLEALQQRLEKYKATAEQAQQEENSSKARRMGRIQKQYEDAIKAYRAGKPVDFEELPTPPGFAPIPLPKSAPAPAEPVRTSLPAIPTRGATSNVNVGQRRASGGIPASSQPPAKLSKQELELHFLTERQKQFKAAALAAKQRGDLNAARHYLKQALGFDKMIEASRNGLRVDISSAPTPPQAKTASASTHPTIATHLPTVAPAKEGMLLAQKSYEDIFSTLEQDLINQIQICDRNREFFINTGDVAKVTEFEKLGAGCKKDLSALRNSFKHGDPAPRFHYETRVFPMIQCCPELGADDLELAIIRGIQLKLPNGYEPKDADIYVKYELPFPKETPQTGKSPRIKGTNAPAFEFFVTLKINSKSRQFLHMLKRIGIKFEIYQKGSFLRSDILLGNAEVKLVILETKAVLHQSLDIIENRKPIGGKLEVKVRVREPLVQKHAEEVREKWLVIDHFSTPASAAAAFGSRQLGAHRTKMT